MNYANIKSAFVFISLAVAFGVFGVRIYRLLWINLRRSQPSPPFRKWGERIKGLIVYVGGQLRLFRFLPPGIAHFFIFWGFVLLSLTILQAIIEGLLAFWEPQFVLPLIGQFGPLALIQDVFIVSVALAVLYALYVRLIVDPMRYQGSHKSQGVLVLGLILTIMVSLIVMNGIRINLGEDPVASWRPVSRAVGGLFAGFSDGTQFTIKEISYWVHLGVVLYFLTELPQGKHFHVVTAIPAVLLRNLEPSGALPPAQQFNGNLGVSAVEQFRWRHLLDFYTCTECGRCQEVCPAFNSGSPLSPKQLMMSLRGQVEDKGMALRGLSSNGRKQEVLQKSLLGDVLSDEVLWSCATCYACDRECPLFIEHVTPIVDMRRYLVCEGKVDAQLQGALASLGRYGNSFGFSPRMRAAWTKNIQPKVKDARRKPVEYLWFVGDYASYNASSKHITQMAAEVFQAAGLDFGILYDSEMNAGNDVRRVGEEGLFEMLIEKNARVLSKCDFQTLVTTDPHTYNTLKNEYPADLIGGRPVLHYSELLDRLIASGQLGINKQLHYRVTYHDPCYLGRVNGVYDPPRRVIEAIGCELVEMPRHHDRAACCGAGGGRIWMEEGVVKERPSESRLREAAGLDGIMHFVVACPKDVAMFLDAAKTTGLQDRIAVNDLIELVHEAI